MHDFCLSFFFFPDRLEVSRTQTGKSPSFSFLPLTVFFLARLPTFFYQPPGEPTPSHRRAFLWPPTKGQCGLFSFQGHFLVHTPLPNSFFFSRTTSLSAIDKTLLFFHASPEFSRVLSGPSFFLKVYNVPQNRVNQ